jgi:16S rRNA (guanine966-N2)-methyltransferase
LTTPLSRSTERTRRSTAKAAGGKPSRSAASNKAAAKPKGALAGAAGKTQRGAPRSGPHEVRIIGGQWKRTKLPVADRPGLRPTPARVRETLFNWLSYLGGGSLAGWRCLDAYAGTGALGFEAASRGAGDVVLVERDAQLVKTLKAIQDKLKPAEGQALKIRCETSDALAWMSRSAPSSFDVVFLDPPFDADELVAPSLIAARRLLAPNAVIYLEGPRACNPEAIAAMGLAVLRQARAGAVHYHLLQAADAMVDASAA